MCSVSFKACIRDVKFSMTMTLLPKLLHKRVRAGKLIFSVKVIGPTFVALHSNGKSIWISLTWFNSHCVSVQVATFPMWSGNLKISEIQDQNYFISIFTFRPAMNSKLFPSKPFSLHKYKNYRTLCLKNICNWLSIGNILNHLHVVHSFISLIVRG